MRMQILQLLPRRGFVVRAGAPMVLGALAACNLSVDNPDRVQDPLLNDPGATSDAAAVPTNFVFQAVYGIENEDFYNFLYWVNANQPYREISVSGTPNEQYYRSTGDPRVRWSTDTAVPTAEFRYVPWLFPTKYTGRDSPINLSTGREMRLVEAEIALRAGDWPAAMSKINGVRTTVISDTTGGKSLAPWPATNITE